MANQLEIIVKATDEASKQLDNIGKSATNMSKEFMVAGGAMMATGIAIIGSLYGIGKAFTDLGEQIGRANIQTGLSTDFLSKMKYAAELADGSLNDVIIGFRTMANVITGAVTGQEASIKTLAEIGLKIEDLKALSPEKQFELIAKKVGEIPDPMTRSAVAMDFFGRSGQTLLPFLVDYNRLMGEAAKHAPIVTDDDIKKAEDFQEAMLNLKDSGQKLLLALGPFVTQVLQPMIDKITELGTKISEWIDKHPELTRILVDWGVKLGIAGIIGGALLFFIGMIQKAILMINSMATALLTRLVPALTTTATAEVTAGGASVGVGGVGGLASKLGLGGVGAAVLPVAAVALGAYDIYKLWDDYKQWQMKSTLIGTRTPADFTFQEYKTAFELAQGNPTLLHELGISGYAKGGIFRGPTMGLIGESGPEAVIPLGKGIGNIIYNITIQSGAMMGNEGDARKFARLILDNIREEQQRTVYGTTA
jgi:hypothetical protein